MISISKFEHEKMKWIDEKMYLNAQIETYKRYNNKGERDEVLAILKLIYLNYTENYEELIKIFGDEASEGIKVLDTTSHIPKRNIYDIKKTISSYKADCVVIMNKTGKTWAMSIKSKNGANPTILNHTPRTAKVFQKEGILRNNLRSLDILIDEYIRCRTTCRINEDVNINILEPMNDTDIRNDVIETIKYFAFEGTGKGNSGCPANSILVVDNNELTFIKCDTKIKQFNYIESILPNIIISMRNKGMPKKINDICKPWIFTHNKNGIIKYKGSLHIRMKYV